MPQSPDWSTSLPTAHRCIAVEPVVAVARDTSIEPVTDSGQVIGLAAPPERGTMISPCGVVKSVIAGGKRAPTVPQSIDVAAVQGEPRIEAGTIKGVHVAADPVVHIVARALLDCALGSGVRRSPDGSRQGAGTSPCSSQVPAPRSRAKSRRLTGCRSCRSADPPCDHRT